MTSLEYWIHLIFGPGNTSTFKKLESEYIFPFFMEYREFSCLESIYGHEYEYISFLAPEYEYIYPLGEVNMGPNYYEVGI